MKHLSENRRIKQIVSEAIKKTLNESNVERIRMEYEEYLYAKKNLEAALRQEAKKGNKEANQALYEFVSKNATWTLERMLGIK